MADLFEEIVRCREAGIPAALATILHTRGSTPGKETMRMLVREDGSFLGTVGGGCLEAEVFAAAKEVIAEETTRTLTFKLTEFETPENGLLCGGEVTVFLEPVTVPTLCCFGGGHISRVLCGLAKTAGFRIVVCEDREAFATKERFPEADGLHVGGFRELGASVPIGPLTYVVVATRGHKGDGEVLAGLFERKERPRYLGMIGSRTKRRILFRKLLEEGLATEEDLARVHSPVGLAIGARSHEEIAVAILAEMILVRRLGKAGPVFPATLTGSGRRAEPGPEG